MALDPPRDARNREVVAQHGLDAVLCRLPENVLLLAGFWPIGSLTYILFPVAGEPVIVALESALDVVPEEIGGRQLTYRSLDGDPIEPAIPLLREAARHAGVARARIGVELGFESVAAGHTAAEVFVPAASTHGAIARALPDATLLDATPALDTARRRKTEREIAALRRANAIAGFGLEAFRRWYEPGRTEAEVAGQVEAAILARGTGHDGARHVRAWTQLMTGPPSAEAHSTHPFTSARVIQPGDLGVLELATVADGFWSDLTRTLVAGRPSARQSELWEAVTAAVDAVLAGARAGMSAAAVDAPARDTIAARGLAGSFPHPTGHGLGFRYHETGPILRPGSSETVEAGTVTSVEPGVYLPGLGGMRLERNVVFRADSLEVLDTAAAALTP